MDDTKQLNFENVQIELNTLFNSINTEEELNQIRLKWLSKNGTLKTWMEQLKFVEPELKKEYGEKINKIRDFINFRFKDAEQNFKNKKINDKLEKEFIDISKTTINSGIGRIHPITEVERLIFSVLQPFGFTVETGPHIETEYYCFDALNIPKHHPARDLQDTFFTTDGNVLRTHTTSVQARILKERKPPIKVASFGAAYRNETEDSSHTAMFHQFELIWVEKDLNLSNLLAIIKHIMAALYGSERKIKFVPKFYPYTEPSLGVQIECTLCRGVGCSFCAGAGWSTVGGAGMIHQKVLTEFNISSTEYSGIAFGLGTSRLTAQQFSIPKGRMIYDNDLRILANLI